MELKIEKTNHKKKKPTGELTFGKCFTDHMFIMDYSCGEWRNARIVPYAPFTLDPSAAVFHYSQSVFEGAKAYRNEKGEIRLFRFDENLKRMNASAERLSIPGFDSEFVHGALRELLKLDADWIPTHKGTSLYIRPTIIAVTEALGVHAATEYTFFIILSPVGAYYKNGLQEVSLYVEDEYIRAAKGGTGNFKTGGNYAGSLKASEKAESMGYDQVMWLDAKEHRYVEEVGSMNIFFVIDGEIVTPELSGSILPGITRKSAIELLKSEGINVKEERIDINDIIKGIKSGSVTEIFGTGTAAVISPVGSCCYKGEKLTVADGKMGKIARKIYDSITAIQTGDAKDVLGWVEVL